MRWRSRRYRSARVRCSASSACWSRYLIDHCWPCGPEFRLGELHENILAPLSADGDGFASDLAKGAAAITRDRPRAEGKDPHPEVGQGERPEGVPQEQPYRLGAEPKAPVLGGKIPMARCARRAEASVLCRRASPTHRPAYAMTQP